MREQIAKDYYNKKEYEEIRDKISAVVTGDEELAKAFAIKRSSYKYASENNWRITVDVTPKSYGTPGENGNETLKLVTKLMTKYNDFINDDENQFYFSSFDTRANCSFYFNFQPVVVKAKQELLG